jgi:DNA-binding Xre family transcriptional regulator
MIETEAKLKYTAKGILASLPFHDAVDRKKRIMEAAGFSHARLSQILNAREGESTSATPEQLEIIAAALECSVADLRNDLL